MRARKRFFVSKDAKETNEAIQKLAQPRGLPPLEYLVRVLVISNGGAK